MPTAVASGGSTSSLRGSTPELALKRTMGLFSGITVVLGSIVGSGIFVSPRGVLLNAGSVGLTLILWAVAGAICLLGAHAFAELGTMIPSSGGMYSYIRNTWGDLAGFAFLWSALIAIFPAAVAVLALTFAYYVLQPMYESCDPPDSAVSILAALSIALLTFINCASVKLALKLQDIFTVIKTLTLAVVIIVGVVVLFQGRTENFQNIFEGTKTGPGNLALALYSGLFSYSGWYTLNFLVEELKNPFRNLPIAVWISMILVTLIYILSNVAYLAVLNKAEILTSNAVAVTFAQKMFGKVALVMPLMVACSTFGSLNGALLSVSRIVFVAARDRRMPAFLSLINVNLFTPTTAVFFQGLVSILYLFLGSDIFILINNVSFLEAISFMACIAALLYLRYKEPHAHRPIKVNIFVPIIFLLVSVFLVVFPLIYSPKDCFIASIVLISSLPVYAVGVLWKKKPVAIDNLLDNTTVFLQKLLNALPESGNEKL